MTEAVRALALDWLETEARPRLICALDLAFLWANPAGHALLQEKDLTLVEGRLTAGSAALQADLAAFVRGCGEAAASLRLPRPARGDFLLLHGRRLGNGGEPACVGITIARGGNGFTPRYADLGGMFQLTAAECRVLERLLRGDTVDAIAVSAGLSVETVRTHVRHIYAKLGADSREAMFARIRPFRLTEEEAV